MRRLTSLLAAGAIAAGLVTTTGCGDNMPSVPGDDAAAAVTDAAPVADAPTDAGTDAAAIGPCLDRPTDLPRPPTGQLPCELLPPGFGA